MLVYRMACSLLPTQSESISTDLNADASEFLKQQDAFVAKVGNAGSNAELFKDLCLPAIDADHLEFNLPLNEVTSLHPPPCPCATGPALLHGRALRMPVVPGAPVPSHTACHGVVNSPRRGCQRYLSASIRPRRTRHQNLLWEVSNGAAVFSRCSMTWQACAGVADAAAAYIWRRGPGGHTVAVVPCRM